MKEQKDHKANNSVITETEISITLWKDGKRKFIATEQDGQYYCPTIDLRTWDKAIVIEVFRNIAKQCF